MAFRLRYIREPGTERCPDEQVLSDSIAAQMGYEPVDPAAASELVVRLSRKGTEIHADFGELDASGNPLWSQHTNALHLDCRQLVSTLALMIRIQTDPPGGPDPAAHAPLTPSAPLSPPTPPLARPRPSLSPLPPAAVLCPTTPASPPAPIPVRAVPAPAPPAPSPSPMLWMSAEAAAAWGRTLRGALGGTGAVELRLPEWSVALASRAFLPSNTVSTQNRPLSITTLGGMLVPCVRDSILFGCGVFGVEHVHAEATSIDVDFVRASLGARVGAAWQAVHTVELHGAVDVLVPLEEKTITRHETGDVWSTAGVAIVLNVGAGVPIAGLF